ncbi:hypothetical protein BAE44_0010153 [Dichanthelium oligosanthes]|uniref:CHCH domain-containing protein n=1 Tax=Dichanthelium oligosanthes TaxID=888268 RepID=A0A1E5VUM8_9POAL|nr:hypothetical protein BAE44_0010153 [Dichanthelium oligosanthes]
MIASYQEKKDYLACLKSAGFQSENCRQFSKKYLECRMERLVCLVLIVYVNLEL